jgi:HEAT repeat protein
MSLLKRALLWVCLSLPAAAPCAASAQDATSAAETDGGKAKGEEAFRKAAERLKSPQAAERAAAANEMGRRGYRFRKEIGELLRPLLRSDPDATVRAAAGRALGRLGAREAVPDLVAALGDSSADVRVVAAAAIWRLPDPSATGPLLERLKDADRAVREWSALALGVIGDMRAVPELVRLLGDPERAVRLAAVRSLGRVGSPDGLEPVVRYLKAGKRDQEEKEEAVAAVTSMKGEGRVNALLELLEAADGDAPQQVRVLSALGQVGGQQALPALRKHATSGPAEVRAAANKAIAEQLGRGKGGSAKEGPPGPPR